MLNYETILSNYDDRLTLLEYLKKVEAALANASAKSFEVEKTGNATIKFVLTFADDTKLESEEIVLQQGESVESAAIAANGHLLLTLTNGDVLDAGSMFNGNVNITGTLSVSGDTSLSNDLNVANKTTTKDLETTGDFEVIGTSEFHDAAQFDSDVNVLGDFSAPNIAGDTLAIAHAATAETFEQSATSWGGSITLALGNALTGCVLTNIYSRMQVINNRMSLVINCSITNNTGSAKTTYDNIAVQYNTIPEKYSSKIIDFLGKSVHDIADNAYVLVAAEKAFAVTSLTATGTGTKSLNVRIAIYNQQYTNVALIGIMADDASLTINDGETLYLSGRIMLELI